MTWTQTQYDGIGALEFRLEVQGWPYQFVTHPDLEKVLSDTRERVACLSRDGIEWSEFCDIPKAELDGGAPNFEFIQTWDDARSLMDMLAKKPTVLVTLNTSVASTTGTMAVTQDGQAWNPASAGPEYVHIGDEVVQGLSISSTADGDAVLTCTRGAWGTDGRAHFAITFQALNATQPCLSDVPFSMEGRWAKLFVYGEGDNPQGDGTQVWRGFVANDARYDGQTGWSVQMEPTHERLNETMFSDAGETVDIRGVHSFVDARIYTDGTTNLDVRISGFWETQADFVTDYSLLLDHARQNTSQPSNGSASWAGSDVETTYAYSGVGTVLSSMGVSLLEVYAEDGSVAYTGGGTGVSGTELEIAGRWSYRYTITGTPSEFIVAVDNVGVLYGNRNEVECCYQPGVGTAEFYSDAGSHQYDMTGTGSSWPATAGTYRIVAKPQVLSFELAGAGRTPRHHGGSANPNSSSDRLYVSRVPTIRTAAAPMVVLRYDDLANDGNPTDIPATINPSSGFLEDAGNVIDFATSSAWAIEGSLADAAPTSFTGVISYGITNTSVVTPATPEDPPALEMDEFFSALEGYSSACTPDVLPPLYSGVLGSSWTSATITESWADREHSYAEPLSFWDVASPVLIMHRRVPYYDENGNLQLDRFFWPRSTVDYTIAADDVLLPDVAPPPTLERSGMLGALSKVVLHQNYDPFTGDEYGPTINIRNVRILSTVGAKRTLEVEWAPFAGERDASSVTSLDLNYVPDDTEVTEHFEHYLSLFGLGTYTITMALPLKYWDMTIGHCVKLGCHSLPNPAEGTFGIYNDSLFWYPGIVIGRAPDLTRGFINFSIVTDFNYVLVIDSE